MVARRSDPPVSQSSDETSALTALNKAPEFKERPDGSVKEYIDARWLNYIEWWDSRANRAKWRYHALRTAVVIGGALIPALVGLRELKVWPDGYDYSWLFAIASIVASLIVAICAGLESTFGFGDIWREKRNAAEVIKSEGFCFIQL